MSIKKKVVVAMSGGIDSSVAAVLLKKQGYEVLGIMLRLWSENEQSSNKCCSLQAVEDAKEIAFMFDIPFYTLDYGDLFKRTVVDYFIDSSVQGYTPNPCFFCNREIRFSYLLKQALDLGASHLATGHYARVKKKVGLYALYKAKDIHKDQSYMLHRLTQQQLAATLFPLGNLNKEQVRELAREWKIPFFQKKDSQDLCFLGADGVRGFLKRQAPGISEEGDICNKEGKVLGKHIGLMNYTIGQRRGLGLAWSEPLFVVGKDHRRNLLIVGNKEERGCKKFKIKQFHSIDGSIPTESCEVEIKIRYHSQSHQAKLTYLSQGQAKVELEQEIWDVAPGQGAVFYRQDEVIGGGIIMKDFSNL